MKHFFVWFSYLLLRITKLIPSFPFQFVNLFILVAYIIPFSFWIDNLQPKNIRVGVYQNKPKIFIDELGSPSGIFIDLLNEIALREAWSIEYVPCDWSDCLEELEEGSIDLMPDVAYSTERDKRFDFHELPVIESYSTVYVNQSQSIHDISQLNDKRVAILSGSIQETVFLQLMSGYGYDVEEVYVDSYEQAFSLTQKGNTDAAVTNQFFGDYFYQEFDLDKTSIVFNVTPLYYATSEGHNQDLLITIDQHLREWREAPESPYYSTLIRWGRKEPTAQIPESVFWIIGSILALLIGAFLIILFLRQQVRARTKHLVHLNAELQKSEERYQTLARISPVGIFRTDVKGKTTYVNPRWCKITGISSEEAMGFGWLKAVHPQDRNNLTAGWQKTINEKTPSFTDYRFLHRDGSVSWVMGQAVPEINHENKIIGYVGTITNITERVNAENELRRLNAELEERVADRTEELQIALLRAQEADRLKSAFLASMSHELRTPLNSIIGFTGVLLQGLAGPLNEEQQKQLGMTQKSARHLLALINDVLDISKIESGQLITDCSKFNMRTAIENTLRSISPLAQNKGLQLKAAIGTDVGMINSDQRRVEQVMLNLLSNAIKFTDHGEVELRCWVEGNDLKVGVRDTGIGIRPEDIQKLFRPFFQLEMGLDRRHEGTGLGLSICKNIIEMLGGEISVESEPGQGSLFTFTLPLDSKGGCFDEDIDH